MTAAEPRLPHLHNKLGEVYLTMKRYPEALAAFEKALEIDSESPMACAGIARAQLELGDPQAALDQALIAAELVHYFPRVHFTIGKALLQLGDSQGAIEALSWKVGTVLIALGGMHFFNLYIFSRIRRRGVLAYAPPPVLPDGCTIVREPVGAGQPPFHSITERA